MKFVIITGLSGAGKSEAARAFEDMGYFCVDNLPPALIHKFAELCSQSEGKVNRIALVIDARGGDFFSQTLDALSDLEKMAFDYRIVFLESSDEALLRRFKETRRRHPLASEGGILDGIHRERVILHDIKERSTHIIDTSSLSARELRNKIIELFGDKDKAETFTVTLVSFGFKYGIPMDADLVFDCRFLPNPYWVESLRDKTGFDPAVQEYVNRWPVTAQFVSKLRDLLGFVIPNVIEEGRTHFIVGIGCTGGKHRSVTIALLLESFLKGQGYHVTTEHRDIAAG